MSNAHAKSEAEGFPPQCHPEIRDRLTRLETLVGDTPDEGLRSDIGDLKTSFHSMEKRIYLAMGGGMVVFYGLEHLLNLKP